LAVWSPCWGASTEAVRATPGKLQTHLVSDKGRHERERERERERESPFKKSRWEGRGTPEKESTTAFCVWSFNPCSSEAALHILPRHKATRPSNQQEATRMVLPQGSQVTGTTSHPATLMKNLPLTSGQESENPRLHLLDWKNGTSWKGDEMVNVSKATRPDGSPVPRELARGRSHPRRPPAHGGPRAHCAPGARRGPSCALAECCVVLPTEGHSWAFRGSMSI